MKTFLSAALRRAHWLMPILLTAAVLMLRIARGAADA
jgi:hypothetical protein